jgi:hypothetical protein
MILERLQLIATKIVAPPHKIRWLTLWNSGTHTREAFHFPAKGFIEKELEGACTKHLYYLLRFRIVHVISWEYFKNRKLIFKKFKKYGKCLGS